MMEVVMEGATKPLLLKEEVDIMEEQEEEDSGGALQTRKRLHHKEGGTNGRRDEDELLLPPPPPEEEEDEHKSVFFDPTKGLWKCRHCDWTYRLSSPSKNCTLNHRGYRHQIEWNLESLESFYGSPNKVPDIVTEVTSNYQLPEVMRFGAQKEDAHGTLILNGKELDKQEKANTQEINHSPSNGQLENGSQSNGSHEVSNGSETKITYMLTIDKSNNLGSTSDGRMGITNGDITELDKDDKHITEDKLNIQEYDLEKIIDEQETHDLYCPHCKSCITRRVILKKRKRTVRQTTRDEPAKEPRITEPSSNDPTQNAPEESERESPEVFRCLSCFSFFVPAGRNFNIFRIFGRREENQEVQGQHPSASPQTHQSENCGSWLLSCFQSGDSPRKADADPAKTSQFTVAQSSSYTITSTSAGGESSVDGHGTIAKPAESKDQLPDESSCQPQTTITTTSETASTSSVYDLGTIVKPTESKNPLPDGSSYHHHQTTTTNIMTTSSHTSSATEIIHSEVMEITEQKVIVNNGQILPLNPAGEAVTEATHIPEIKDFLATATTPFEKGSFPTQEIRPRQIPNEPASPDHLALPISDAPATENPPPRISEQRDDWDILKAIVYGGLVESVMSLSIVSAAAASGAKTLDIFILGIANLIGGIPLIFHNINDLRNLGDVGAENDERVSHYWLQLGRRSKFQLHMVLALLSYILFGLLPPVIYGLSFRKSDNRENKMMAVAAASLACVAMLAVGKAHVKRPSTYFKTLMYYLTIAVSASGLSYVAGVLITRLLTHFGLVDQGGSATPTPNLSSFPYAVGAETSVWASF